MPKTDYFALVTTLLHASPTLQKLELTAAAAMLPRGSTDPLVQYVVKDPDQAVKTTMAVLAAVKADPPLVAALTAKYGPKTPVPAPPAA